MHARQASEGGWQPGDHLLDYCQPGSDSDAQAADAAEGGGAWPLQHAASSSTDASLRLPSDQDDSTSQESASEERRRQYAASEGAQTAGEVYLQYALS
jgi:hypothetical protein